MRRRLILTVLAFAAPAALLNAQTESPCPLHAEHQKQAAEAHDSHAALDHRGGEVMGFEQARTTHHFLLSTDGGTIQVEANDPADAATVTKVRSHLAEVAQAFSRGDFGMPAEIHARALPGVPEMSRLKDAISWRYEEMEHGARVRITTADAAALAAVHAFLRAQIEDHRTGDPPVPSP